MIFFVVFLSFVLISHSVEISLKEAVELALKNNRQLKKLKRELKSERFTKKTRIFERFSPKSSFEVSKDELSLKASILLLEFGRRAKAIEAEKYRVKLREEILKEFENFLKIKVAEIYFNILIYDLMAQEKREYMAVAYVRFDRERQKMELGLSDIEKVSRLERLYRKYRKELFEAQRKYNENLYKLKRYLGLKIDEDVEVKPLDFKIPENLALSEKELLKYLKNNYQIRKKEFEIAYYSELEKGERILWKPEVYLRGKFSYPFEKKRIESEFNTILRVPIFDPASRYRRKSIKQKKLSLVQEKNEITEKVKQEIFTFPYVWDELIENYKYAKSYFRWAENNLDLKRSQYELELAFDLGYAMAEYTKAERMLLESKVKIILFLMNVYHTIGLDPMNAFKEKHFFLKERTEF